MNRVTLNTAVQILTRVLELASGLLVNAWLARQWGSAAFGQIGFFTNLAAICAFLFDFGIGNMLMRQVANDRVAARQYLVSGLFAMLPLSVLGAGVLVGIGLICGRSGDWPVLVLASLLMLFGAVSQLFRACFYAYERMEFETYPVISERACWLVAGIWLALQPPSLLALFSVMLATRLLNVAVSAWLFVRHILPLTAPARFAPGHALGLIREAVPFGLNQAFYTLTASVDVVLIAYWAGDTEAGHYRAAAMLMAAVSLVVLSFMNAIFPQMTAAARSGPAAVAKYQVAAARLMMLAALPACLFLAIYARPVVTLLYGEAYAPAALLLSLLALSLPLRFLDHALGTALTACNEQGKRMRCAGIAAGVNVVANAVLIGPFHAVGACLAGVVSAVVAIALMHRALRASFVAELGASGLGQGLVLSGLILLPLVALGAPMLVSALLLATLYPLIGLRFLTPFENGLFGRTPAAR